jgi:hypothetical protein
VTRTLVATLALFLALASSAAATIVPQRGIAGVRIGMAPDQVRDVLGEPLRVVHGRNDFGPYTEYRYPHLLRVLLQGNASVTALETTGKRERTRSGAGVGSTEAELVAGVPGLRCETFLGTRSCHVGAFEPGRRVTDFKLRAGRVVRVTVGIVVD